MTNMPLDLLEAAEEMLDACKAEGIVKEMTEAWDAAIAFEKSIREKREAVIEAARGIIQIRLKIPATDCRREKNCPEERLARAIEAMAQASGEGRTG